MNYVRYNREERDICAHLFRLLLQDQTSWSPLKAFLKKDCVDRPRIFCEVALIRDAYYERKPDIEAFVVSLCDLIARQNGISSYTKFRDLPEELKNPKETHPKQIAFKMRGSRFRVTNADGTVYGTLQAMFNAKPDLAICEGNNLYVYEAKYTLGFDPEQLRRTRDIAEAWQELLFEDLGFEVKPELHGIRTLGLRKYSPDVSWEEVHDLALRYWGVDDFSTIVLSKVLEQG